MGRHSFVAPRELKNPAAARGIALAGVVGVLAGAGIPAANAAPQEAGAKDATELATAQVSFADAQVAEPVAVEENTVSLGDVGAGEWTIESVDVEVEEASEVVVEEVAAAPVVEAAPAVEVSSTPVPPSAASSSIVATAMSYQGAPYVWGGNTPSGWDCSGFVKWVFAQHGISLPRTSDAMLGSGQQLPYSEAQPGDLLIWPGHVGISLGNGQNIAAWNPNRGTGVGQDSWLGTPVVVRVG